MNSVILIGRLVKDPDLVDAGDKKKVDFTLAVNTKVKGKADFISCTAWGKTAEIMTKYLNKGSQVCVYGEIKNNNYEDSKGVKHYGMKVQVNSVEFLGSKNDIEADESENPDYPKDIPSPSPYDYLKKEEPKPSPFENTPSRYGVTDDDLPF